MRAKSIEYSRARRSFNTLWLRQLYSRYMELNFEALNAGGLHPDYENEAEILEKEIKRLCKELGIFYSYRYGWVKILESGW